MSEFINDAIFAGRGIESQTEHEIISVKNCGDINDDDIIDIVDVVLIGVSFGQTGANLPTDINRDGIIDILDITLADANFEKETQIWNCLGR